MSDKLRLGVIFGGRSSEHEVSLVSACSLIRAIDRSKYIIIPIGIDKAGFVASKSAAYKMLLSKGLSFEDFEENLGFAYKDLAYGLINPSLIKRLLDLVFPILHGPNGEDGVIQGIFEFAQLPFVGSGVLGSAVSMDKDIMKKIVSFHNIPILPFLSIKQDEWDNKDKRALFNANLSKTLSYPLFVKPSSMGSSVGVSKVYKSTELEKALLLAFNYDNKAIVETGIEARELEVALLGNSVVKNSVVGEIIPSADFYDYEAKYGSSVSKLVIPAAIDKDIEKRLVGYAKRAFSVLECSGLARADFFLDKRDGSVYFNEVNTMPGFTEKSMYPKLFEHSGVSYTELIDSIIELALMRGRGKQGSKLF